MFEVGKDIFKHGFMGARGDGVARKRLWVMYSVFFCAFALFVGRTLQLGIQGTDRSRLAGVDDEWVVQRADIVDRNGDILAKNVESGHIILRNRAVREQDRDAVAQTIHKALPYEYSLSDAIALVNSSRRFIRLKKYASDAQRQIIQAARLEGLEIEKVQTRKYPKRRLFSHIVGFVGEDGRGLEGAERTYNDYLQENKDPLRLSVDSRIQAVFYEQLSFAMQKYQTKAAMGMLMNSRTGEIIAMVSLPDFDPENLRADPVANRLFKPMRNVYDMGSVFKVFNTALAFENGIDKEYYVKEPFKIPDKFGRTAAKISDIRSFKPPRPNLTVEEIMVHSCNVGSAQIALDLPDDAQKEFFERLHMDGPLDLEFGRTERTLLPKKWGPVERATVAFGHGISVTPMHLLLAMNAVTNGGIYIYPTLQKRNVGIVKGERVLADEISAKIRPIMLRVAEETSGKQARVSGIQIGGKTATAEKYINGKIDRKRNVTAFAGIFPVHAPQYTILVVLDEPHATEESWGWRTAAWNAVPTTGKILDSILPLLFE
ncbi:MAG: penicillin-binding protein 2 [Alphaproteobacteria bacterium]|nr:penicillin-binding protein 2 [Alphaproteobacteria bacterium]MBR6685445.1 penicillin-binding protein 2 [Alphaproteobacteria bacterium]